jgi:hypothetical protein
VDARTRSLVARKSITASVYFCWRSARSLAKDCQKPVPAVSKAATAAIARLAQAGDLGRACAGH